MKKTKEEIKFMKIVYMYEITRSLFLSISTLIIMSTLFILLNMTFPFARIPSILLFLILWLTLTIAMTFKERQINNLRRIIGWK